MSKIEISHVVRAILVKITIVPVEAIAIKAEDIIP